MAINLNGGNGIPSFSEWKKQQKENSGKSAVSGSDFKANNTRSMLDTSSLGYADSRGVPLGNTKQLDGGAQRKAQQLRFAAEKLSSMPLTDEDKKTLDEAQFLRLSRQGGAADRLDADIRERQREYQSGISRKLDKLKEKAYYTEQEGIRTVGEKLAAGDPEFESKAAAGYEDKSNPIQKMRQKLVSDLPDSADYGVYGATLDEQLKKIDSGEKNGAISTGLLNGMNGINPADMTADELKTYSYWYNKSPNAAKRYLESISADVNKRTAEREAEFYTDDSRELRNMGIGGTALALGRELMLDYTSPAAYASALASKLTGKPYDPYSAANRGTINASAMQEGLTGDLPTLGKFLADTGISTVQYLSRIPLGAAGLVIMASGAAGKTANEVKRNGGTTDQALTLGTVAGLAEYASEKIPFENIKAAFSGGEKKALARALEKVMKSKIGSVAGSALEEGLEEVISEYINNIANGVVLGDESDMKKYALQLISQGMSYEEATKAAFKQYYVTNPLIAFAGGALSGGVMAGIGEGYNGARNAIINNAENRYFKANGQKLLDSYEKSNGIGNNIEMTSDEQQLNDAAKEYSAPGNVDIEADSDLLSDPEVSAAIEQLTAKEQNTPAADNSAAPQVSPKNQFANPAGSIVLDTAVQASRKQRADAAKTDVERSGILAGATDTDISIAKSLSEVFGRKIIFDSTDASVNGKFSDGTIYVNPNGSDNVVTILAHELTHSAEGSAEYDILKRCIKQDLADRGKMWQTLKDEVREKYASRYESMGQSFTDADCESETLALAAQALFEDEASMQSFVKQNRSSASRLWYKISRAAERLKQDISYRFGRGEPDVEARKRQLAVRQVEDARDALAKALRATKNAARSSGESMSIKYDRENVPYVEIDKDVFEGVPKDKWIGTIKSQIPLVSVKLGNSEIEIKNKPSIHETLNSRYARYVRNGYNNDGGDLYPDRLNTLTKADEIIRATRNYVNEALNHKRKDNIIQFARGDVNISIGGREYKANSVFGYTRSGKIVLYDIIDFESTSINKRSADVTTQTPVDAVSRRNFTSADTNSISHSTGNVNTLNEEKTDSTKYSLADSALARAKQMEADDASPMTIKNATGWYRDDSGSWKKQWNKSSNMFDAEIDRTERNANGGINQMLADRKTTAAQLDEITSSAKKHFGVTYDWNKAGYILTDGSRLDFSGKHQGYDTGMRSVDHRDIGEVYSDGSDGVNAMIDFMKKGNIRIMPESNSINLSVAPTTKQETALRQFIRRANGEVIIDIDDANGKTVRSLEYDAGTSAETILDAISQYFTKGSENESDIAMYHRMGDQYSVADDQYGTKALNTAEELNRTKALAMLKSGKDPQYVFEVTGWFYDNFGTFMVDHGADLYSYGDNDIESAKSAKTEVKEQETKPKSEQLGVDQLRKAYNLGEREARRMINKALHTAPDMTPDAQYVKSLVDELSGSYVTDRKKREIIERLTDIYDRMGDADASGTPAMSNGNIADEFNRLATDILDSRQFRDTDKAEMQKRLKAEFKSPMFVSATARGDFAEGWNNVRKSYFGKINLTSDRAKGTPVDVRYMELSDAYPDWFPARIENETEQLEQIMSVCDRIFDKEFPIESYYNFSGWQEQYKKDHAELVEKLAAGYRDLKQQPRTWADKIIKDINDERSKMEKLHESEIKRLIEEAERDAREQLARYEQIMIDTQKENTEREKSIHDYYAGREQSRLDREAKAKAENEARRIRRGGAIDYTAINQALGDNSYSAKMQKLYDAQKKLSEEYSKYANVDIEAIEDADTKEYVKRLKERLDDMNTYINRVGQAVRKLKRGNALELIAKGDIMKWKDKQSGYMYSRETTRRNIEDISKGDELGQEIIRNYIDPVQRDVAESTRFKNRLRERVKALGLGLKPTGKNKLSESAFVQLLGEARDNIAMLENNAGNIIPGKNGEPMREGKTLSDWRGIRDTLMLENPDMDMAKINKAISEFQSIYDELFQLINNVRVLNGYAPAEYHHGYFPHYNNDAGTDGIVSNLMSGLGFNIEMEGLPTSINGLTHTFRPGTKYMSNLKQRSVYGVGEQYNGFTLNSGAVEGFDRYLETAADVIYLTGDIQNLRALSDAIRYSTTDDGVRKQADDIESDGQLTPQEKDSLIASLYEGKQKFRLRNFVIDLEEYTNILAGKKSMKDRRWEQNFGRGMYQVMKKVEQRITANQIALNPGSWLTNFVPLTQAGSVLTQRQLLGAMLDTCKAVIHNDGFAARSDFLTNRRCSESLVKSGADKFQESLSKPMAIIDGFTSETIVRARYAQNLKKGLNETDALREADVFANKLMANRAKGDMPTAFYSVNPVSKLFTMYQLEVNNQWSFMFKDLPKEANGSLRKLAAMLFKLCIGSWLYNEIYEKLVGRRCAFDPLDMLNDFAGDLTGYKLPSLDKAIDAGVHSITNFARKILFGETAINPVKIDELFKAKKVGVTNAVTNLVKDAGGEVPFFGGVLFGGGRIPISSALPDPGNLINAVDFSTESAGSKRLEMGLKEAAKPVFYMLPPFGGGQLKKAAEGVTAFALGGSYTLDNEGKKKLQYPIENQTAGQVALNLPRAVLFGKTANKYGREWVDNGFGSYSAKATEAYQALVDDGISQADALAAVDSIKSESKRAGKVKALLSSSGSSAAKRKVFENIVLSSDDAIESAAEKLNTLESAGISLDNYLSVYDTYLSVSGDSRKLNVISDIDGMNLSSEQKDVLYCCFYREGGLADTPWHSNGVKKAVLPELGLPELTMPELKLPEISLPKLK